MAEGTHWEWRGFGTLTTDAEAAFRERPLAYSGEWDEPEDQYLWIPSSPINVKVRIGGSQEGLKLKRFVRREQDIELWSEKRAELYPFKTLDAATLTAIGTTLGLTFGAVPPPPLSAQQTLDLFRHATPTPSVVTVSKKRQTRRYSEHVTIELAYLKKVDVNGRAATVAPALTSIAIENDVDLTSASDDDVTRAFGEIDAAVRASKLRESGYTEKNYLRAIAEWAAAASV